MRLRTVIALLPVLAAPVYAAVISDARQNFDDLIRQGRTAFLASDLDRAEAAYNQACQAGVADAYPVAQAVTCENLLASVDEARGNPARAEQRFLRAVSAAEQAGPAFQPLYCARLIDLGEHYHRQGKSADAEATLLKAVDLARTLSVVQPGLLPEALAHLGSLYSASADPERGRAALTEALALIASAESRGEHIVQPLELAYTRDCLGMIELAAGHHRVAESHLRESLALATATLGEDHPVTAAYQTSLAVILIAERQYDRASLLLRRAELVVGQNKSAGGSEFAVICAQMSAAFSGESKWALAEDYALRAVSILSEQARPNPQSIAMAQVTLAAIYVHTSDLAAAERILPVAVDTERRTGANSGTLAEAVQLLAELPARQHNWQSAEGLYREAIALSERNGATRPTVGAMLLALAEVLKHEGGSKDEVRALENQAHNILRSGSQSTPRV